MSGLRASAAGLASVAICLSGGVARAAEPVVPPGGAEMALSLADAVALGEKRNFRMARSQRNDRTAVLREDIAKAALLPRVDISAFGSQSERAYWERDPGVPGTFTSTSSTFQAGLNASVSMPIDLFGTLGHQVRQADLAKVNADLDVTQSALDVDTDVRTAYVEALRAQEDADAEQRGVDDLEAFEGHARTRAPAVAGFLEVELSNARQSLNSARTNADLVQSTLKQDLRLPLEARIRLTSHLQPDVPGVDRNALYDAALAMRADVRQAKLRLTQAELSAKQVGDYLKPSIYITAYANQSILGEAPWQLNGSRFLGNGVVATLYVPLISWDWGVLKHNREAALIQVDQARDDIVEQQERVQLEIRQVLISLDRAKQRLDSLPDTDKAHQALTQAEASLLATPPDQAQNLLAQVSNARNAWRLAQTAKADALADYYEALFRLAHAVGGETAAIGSTGLAPGPGG